LINDELKDMDPAWRLYFDQLTNALQINAGLEGLVAPSQPTANIAVIAANQLQNGSFSTAGGTLIYDSTTNQLKVAILSGGIPTFHVITVV
jgi:hypothetical protein